MGKRKAEAYNVFVDCGESNPNHAKCLWIDNSSNEPAPKKPCLDEICNKGGSTSGMYSHLSRKHQVLKDDIKNFNINMLIDNYNEYKLTADPSNFANDKSMQASVARLAARDRMSFRSIANSEDIHRWSKQDGKEVPKSADTVRLSIHDYALKVKASEREKLMKMKANGKKFNLTFDEWMSKGRERYLNVSLSNRKEHFDLGCHKIDGSLPATKLEEMLTRIIGEWGLEWSDIVGLSMDGCSVNVKLGKHSEAIAQLCYAHGIHLAMTKVYYKKKKKTSARGMVTYELPDDEDDEEEEIEIEMDAGFDVTGDPMHEDDYDDDEFEEKYRLILELAKKIRKIVKLLMNKRVHREAFLSHLIADKISTEMLMLILDMVTRWNTFYLMCERFLKCLSAILKTLIDIGSSLTLTTQEQDLLREIVRVSAPVYHTVKALCADDANLAIADAVFFHMFENLGGIQTQLSRKVVIELKIRIEERRTIASDVIHHLTNFGSPQPIAKYLKVAALKDVEKSMKEYAERFCGDLMSAQHLEAAAAAHNDENSESGDLSFEDQVKMIFKENSSDNIINSTVSPPQPAKNRSSGSTRGRPRQLTPFDIELEELKRNKRRGEITQKVLEYLLVIKPTSVDSERAFSLAGLFVTRIRSLLRSKSIWALTYLNSFFTKIFPKTKN